MIEYNSLFQYYYVIIAQNENRRQQKNIIIISVMLGIVILVFEILMIILYGIFIRTDSITTSVITSLDSGLFFIAAYAFLAIKGRIIDWTMLTHFLFIAMICLQMNTLYYYFWASAFAQVFNSTSSISSSVFISGLQATLTVVITVSMFASRLTQLSVFIVTMIQVFFFALNWGICRWGINTITSGGAMNIWLFGLVFAACIKRIRFPQLRQTNNAKYFTKTMQVISLVIVIITWPPLNQLMANLDLTVANLDSGALLLQNAYIQTWLCLFSCIVTTLGLRVMGQKIRLEKIIPSVINTGILVSSSACVIIDPFASILLGILGPILYFLYDKYGQKIQETGYPVDGIVMAFLGGTFSAIFAGGRNGRTPALSSDPGRQGGLQFAALIVSLIFSIIFGLLTGLILRFSNSEDVELTDMGIWQIQTQMLPLYCDDPKLQRLYKIEDKQRLQQQNVQFSLKQRFLATKLKQSKMLEQGKIIKQDIDPQSKIAEQNVQSSQK